MKDDVGGRYDSDRYWWTSQSGRQARSLLRQEQRHVFGSQRPGQVVALGDVAPHPSEKLQLLGALYPSPVTSSPSEWASDTTASTMILLLGFSPKLSKNRRSIFKPSTGNRSR